MDRFGLVVDLQPWPAPVDALDTERLGAPLRDAFGTVRTWHPVAGDHDPQGRAATTDEALGAVIVSGSVAMVGDRTAWMDVLAQAVDRWAARRVPVLGTCFGHQFLAHHFGGTLGSFPQRRIAWAPLHILDPHDPLFDGLPPAPPLLWTHRDRVLKVPPELAVTAGSEDVPVEAFRHRDLPVWGLQAHPETDRELMQAIVRVDPEAAPALGRQPWSAYDDAAGGDILRRFAAFAAAAPGHAPG